MRENSRHVLSLLILFRRIARQSDVDQFGPFHFLHPCQNLLQQPDSRPWQKYEFEGCPVLAHQKNPHQYYPGEVGTSHSVDSMGMQLPNDGAA